MTSLRTWYDSQNEQQPVGLGQTVKHPHLMGCPGSGVVDGWEGCSTLHSLLVKLCFAQTIEAEPILLPVLTATLQASVRHVAEGQLAIGHRLSGTSHHLGAMQSHPHPGMPPDCTFRDYVRCI